MINNISRLPDAYAKEELSNLYAILELAYGISSSSQADYEDINNSRDINQAYGKTLDNYGAMYGVPRHGTTDDQYRIRIQNQIALNFIGSDYNSILSAISTMFADNTAFLSSRVKWNSTFRIIDDTLIMIGGDNSIITNPLCSVTIVGLTLNALEKTGYQSQEVNQLIENMLPIGVRLIPPYYAGTLLLFDDNFRGGGNFSGTDLKERYPKLYEAWWDGQEAYAEGKEIGLKGTGTVPSEFMRYAPVDSTGNKYYQITGTYQGGTLGILSD